MLSSRFVALREIAVLAETGALTARVRARLVFLLDPARPLEGPSDPAAFFGAWLVSAVVIVVIIVPGLPVERHAVQHHAKQVAQHAVMELIDLPILLNEIEVR